MKNYRRSLGFTLIELAFVMVIVAILLAVSAGALLRMQPVNRIRRESWQLYMTLTKARMLSINEGRPYGVVFLNHSSTYPAPCQTSDCYFIFRDWNSDGKYQHPSGQPLTHTCLPWINTGCNEEPIMGKVLYRTKIAKKRTGAPVITFQDYLDTYLQDYQSTSPDIFALDSKTFFSTVLGKAFTQAQTGSTTQVVVTFNNLGGIVQASEIKGNNGILIQYKKSGTETAKTPQGGVGVNISSGVTTRRKITME